MLSKCQAPECHSRLSIHWFSQSFGPEVECLVLALMQIPGLHLSLRWEHQGGALGLCSAHFLRCAHSDPSEQALWQPGLESESCGLEGRSILLTPNYHGEWKVWLAIRSCRFGTIHARKMVSSKGADSRWVRTPRSVEMPSLGRKWSSDWCSWGSCHRESSTWLLHGRAFRV